jgi:hypothetical protein
VIPVRSNILSFLTKGTEGTGGYFKNPVAITFFYGTPSEKRSLGGFNFMDVLVE